MSNSTGQVLNPEELREFVADVLDLDVESVTDDANFMAELGVDSLKALEVLVALERRYQIKLNEEELKDMTCFADVRDFVSEKLAVA
jgi:acyl carrier protein